MKRARAGLIRSRFSYSLSGRFDRGGGDGPAGFGFLRLMSRREGSGPARDDGVCLTTVTGPLGPEKGGVSRQAPSRLRESQKSVIPQDRPAARQPSRGLSAHRHYQHYPYYPFYELFLISPLYCGTRTAFTLFPGIFA